MGVFLFPLLYFWAAPGCCRITLYRPAGAARPSPTGLGPVGHDRCRAVPTHRTAGRPKHLRCSRALSRARQGRPRGRRLRRSSDPLTGAAGRARLIASAPGGMSTLPSHQGECPGGRPVWGLSETSASPFADASPSLDFIHGGCHASDLSRSNTLPVRDKCVVLRSPLCR